MEIVNRVSQAVADYESNNWHTPNTVYLGIQEWGEFIDLPMPYTYNPKAPGNWLMGMRVHMVNEPTHLKVVITDG